MGNRASWNIGGLRSRDKGGKKHNKRSQRRYHEERKKELE